MTDVIIQAVPLLNNDRTALCRIVLNGSELVTIINLLFVDAYTIIDVI